MARRKVPFTSEIDEQCKLAYAANFGEVPYGDVTKINENDVPAHTLLCGGFPCQPFSIIGQRRGFEDTRGTLFFDIARIIRHKQPEAFILENVKQLVGHNGGNTIRVIIETLRDELGYEVEYKTLNASDYGLPQKRERVFIIGARSLSQFEWPRKLDEYTPLENVLEKRVDKKYYASEPIIKRRKEVHTSKHKLSIWHENKSGNISSYPFSCALRAGASYNYLLVNGERRLTPREMLRLQGFPDRFKIVTNDSQTRKQAGNAVPINLVHAVADSLLACLDKQGKLTLK
jgi:DNA (cytosine-5)-methyltransferase 1